MKNLNRIEPKNLLVPCQAPSRRPQETYGDFLTEILFSASSPTVSTNVYLLTRCSAGFFLQEIFSRILLLPLLMKVVIDSMRQI